MEKTGGIGVLVNYEVVPSPCIDICVMEDEGYCKGCLRSVSEIAQWRKLSANKKLEILENIKERKNESISNIRE
jgi:predicted Fe-S protein YdhL (DUF1289 family)